jgi:adenylyltransferase/sulfurtransferase
LLSDAELDRYARQIILPAFGGAGQAKLKAAHIALIGAGGIGCPAVTYLAAAGVGRLTIIDHDHVERSNLHRQPLFTDADIGAPKADIAAAAARRINPHVEALPIVQRVDADNAGTLLTGADLILDGCDNFATRLAVNRAAVARRIPLLSARSRGKSRFMKAGARTAPAMPASSATTRTGPASTAPSRA